jgi:hypothetical protein
MPAHQRLGIIQGPDQGRHSNGIPPVSQGHGYIAQQAAALGPQDGATPEASPEALIVQGSEVHKERGHALFPWLESCLGSSLSKTPVPGTDLLADVAAKNAVAHLRPQFAGDGAF